MVAALLAGACTFEKRRLHFVELEQVLPHVAGVGRTPLCLVYEVELPMTSSPPLVQALGLPWQSFNPQQQAGASFGSFVVRIPIKRKEAQGYASAQSKPRLS